MANSKNDELLENAFSELRRGLLVLAVLNQLSEEAYGYSLIKHLADKGMSIDQGTLYPLLRRLESQGLLVSNWRVESDRPRRYYAISENGKEILPRLNSEWKSLVTIMSGVLK
jgi:DNA-binding PadR family transcriptional regulator